MSNDVLQITRLSGNDGIVTAGKVQYVAQGGNFIDHGFTHVGAMSVLKRSCVMNTYGFAFAYKVGPMAHLLISTTMAI